LAAEEEAATRTALMVADHNESVAVPVDDDVTVAPAAGLPAGVDAACSGKTPAPDADCEVVDVTRATRYYRGCGPVSVCESVTGRSTKKTDGGIGLFWHRGFLRAVFEENSGISIEKIRALFSGTSSRTCN